MERVRATSQTSSFGTITRIGHNADRFYNSNMYKELKISNNVLTTDNIFPVELLNKIINNSSEDMSVIPDNSLQLMITSPPYNVTKDYDDDLTLKEYLNMLENVLAETYRVLVNGGRACINVANIGRKPYIPLSSHITELMLKIGFLMRGEIIWNKGAGAGTSMAWGSWQSASNPVLRDVHEYILVFSKGDFKLDKKDKEDTITKEQFMEYTKSVWNMNTESAKKIGHPAPFPVELPYRLIQLFSYKNDIILDTFMGSGTTAIAAINTERNYIGFEISEEYCKLAENRINEINSSIF